MLSVLKEYTDEGCDEDEDGMSRHLSPRVHPNDPDSLITDSIPETKTCKYSYILKHLTLAPQEIRLKVGEGLKNFFFEIDYHSDSFLTSFQSALNLLP